jgi:hypothetical protein
VAAREIAKQDPIHGKIRLSQFSHGGGGGGKIALAVLQDILSQSAPIAGFSDLAARAIGTGAPLARASRLDGFQAGGFAIFGAAARDYTTISRNSLRQNRVSRGRTTVAQTTLQRNEFNCIDRWR